MCGVVGVVQKDTVNQTLYDALLVLQHRGQDAAGMVISDGDRMHLRKDNGLVSHVFEERHMVRLPGIMGIGHVRYPTAGSSSSAEAQPMYVSSPYGLSLAHNGNLTNAEEMRKFLRDEAKRHLNTDSDSEILLNVLAHELQETGHKKAEPETVFEAISRVQSRCRGAYAAVAMIVGGGIVGFRDPRGIRPLLLGSRRGALSTEYMIASENVAFDTLGFEVVRDVAPGEAVYITRDGELHSQVCCSDFEHTPCIFEHVYLARNDAVLDGVSTYQTRLRLGEKLADRYLDYSNKHGVEADVVIPVPETSNANALAFASKIGLPYRDGFVRNRYVGRTFIMPGQDVRQRSVRRKLNVIKSEFRDKRVLLVEDSIVRGTTTRQIIQQVRAAGAKEVSMLVASPPVCYPNVYGIDMPSKEELVANGRTIDEIKEFIRADHLIYQSFDDLIDSARVDNPQIKNFECSIFTGEYHSEDVDEEYLLELSNRRKDSKKNKRDSELRDLNNLVQLQFS
ncbi:MAG: amidophosphoribosyltransferase [Gammaproteobacteria bacterium]|nr:amidophosphoribosyltransferase [Gammaproteobacteria bacterium]